MPIPRADQHGDGVAVHHQQHDQHRDADRDLDRHSVALACHGQVGDGDPGPVRLTCRRLPAVVWSTISDTRCERRRTSGAQGAGQATGTTQACRPAGQNGRSDGVWMKSCNMTTSSSRRRRRQTPVDGFLVGSHPRSSERTTSRSSVPVPGTFGHLAGGDGGRRVGGHHGQPGASAPCR